MLNRSGVIESLKVHFYHTNCGFPFSREWHDGKLFAKLAFLTFKIPHSRSDNIVAIFGWGL